MSDSDVLELHTPCPDCGSSDARCVYDDGHTHCFSCGAHHNGDRMTDTTTDAPAPKGKELLPFGRYADLVKRKIREETCKKFGYFVTEFGDKPVQVAPYFRDGKVVAQKVRFPNKDFTVRGDLSTAPLFGMHLWPATGKRIVVVEGEIDAMSYAQASGLSWPVVSVPNGAQGAAKSIKANIEFLEGYETVVFLFDMDDPGQKAAAECAEILTPGKAAIAQLPLKDANEMLQAGRIKELTQAAWNAQAKRPDGIINGADLWEEVEKPIVMGTPYPWEGLNKVLFGLRPREIVTITAGSGIGKSALCREIAYHLAQHCGETVGYVALEEANARTGLGFMGLHLSVPIHLPGYEVTPDERRRAFDETFGTGRYFLYDHFGSLDSDNLLGKLKFMVKACGVKRLILDHLSIIVSGMDLEGDERRMLDYTMTKLRSFCEETNVGLVLVSHLKRPQGQGHEEGAMTSLAQLRGSAAIAQLSDAVIGAERNQQADDEEDRNLVVLRVLKNRYAGITGLAAALRYNPDTGRLIEVPFTVGEKGEVVGGRPGDDFKSSSKRLMTAEEDAPF